MMINCPECGKQVSDQAQTCPNCGYQLKPIIVRDVPPAKMKNSTLSTVACILALFTITSPIAFLIAIIDLAKRDKMHKHTGSWFAIIWTILAFIILGGSSGKKDDDLTTGTVASSDVQGNNTKETSKEASTEFMVGQTVSSDKYGLKISFLSSGIYESDNQFLQPAEGNIYYYCEFEFENISDDDSVVDIFKAYVDGYSVDSKYLSTDDYIGVTTLSAGKKIKGRVYYEIQKDFEKLELEYEWNMFLDDKVTFVVTQ